MNNNEKLAVDIEKLNSLLDKSSSSEFTLLDMMGLTSVFSNLTKLYFESLDSTIYKEFRDISNYILSTKDEISNLQASHIKDEKIQNAGAELDAIVNSTEEATETIMESAEVIMSADQNDVEGFKKVVNEEIIKIFEACSFQDLTGQRISRIVDTLKYIEARIDRFSKAFEGSAYEGNAMLSNEEKQELERKKKLHLHGPQDSGDAIDQDDVDSYFGSNDTKNSDSDNSENSEKDAGQDDIDDMFK